MNVSSTTFRRHVSQVVCVRTEKQMIGIDAQRVVTPMANEQSVRDGTVCKCPRQTMSTPRFVANPDTTVTGRGNGSRPVPTSVFGTISVLPEVCYLLIRPVLAGAFARTAKGVSSWASRARWSNRQWFVTVSARRRDTRGAFSEGRVSARPGTELMLILGNVGRGSVERLAARFADTLDTWAGAGILIGHLTVLSLGANPRTVQPVAGLLLACNSTTKAHADAEIEAFNARYPGGAP